MDWGSVDHQKKVAELIGYDFSQWDPKDKKQVKLLAQKAQKALLSGKDCHGKWLSYYDRSWLETFTGWSG